MKLFALNSTRSLGERIATGLGVALDEHEERNFEDGEHKIRSLVNVQNENVFVIQSLYGDMAESVNDKLCRLLFFIGALKDAGAEKVTAIVPYLCYSRKDRRTKSNDPITTKYIARLFEAAGTDALVTMEVHNVQAFENSFRIPVKNLDARMLLARHIERLPGIEHVVVVSPDFGGIKRAEQFRATLTGLINREVDIMFMEKYRSSGNVWGERISGGGEVKGATAIIIDDLVSTGGTIARAAAACSKAGAAKVLAFATHGLFVGNAGDTLSTKDIDQVIVTNTIPPFRVEGTALMEKLTVLDVAGVVVESLVV